MAKFPVKVHCSALLGLLLLIILTGCRRPEPEPLLPEGCVAAGYANYSIENDSKTIANVRDVLETPLERMRTTAQAVDTNADVSAFDINSFRHFFSFNKSDCRWGLVTISNIPCTTNSAERIQIPDIGIVICASMDPAQTIASMRSSLNDMCGGKLTASFINHQKIWFLEHKDFDRFNNLRPCMTFKDKNLMLIASNPDLLQQLVSLYRKGKMGLLPPEHPLLRVIAPDPRIISQFMAINIKQFINWIFITEQLKKSDEIHQVGTSIDLLCALDIETRIIPKSNFFCVSARIDCTNETAAQSLCKMLTTLKTDGKMALALAKNARPEYGILAKWLNLATIGTIDKTIIVDLTFNPDDFSAIDKLLPVATWAAHAKGQSR